LCRSTGCPHFLKFNGLIIKLKSNDVFFVVEIIESWKADHTLIVSLPSVAMCTTPDESYNHEELLPPFLANQLAFFKDDHVMMQIQVEGKFYSVAISYHSSTSKCAHVW